MLPVSLKVLTGLTSYSSHSSRIVPGNIYLGFVVIARTIWLWSSWTLCVVIQTTNFCGACMNDVSIVKGHDDGFWSDSMSSLCPQLGIQKCSNIHVATLMSSAWLFRSIV